MVAIKVNMLKTDQELRKLLGLELIITGLLKWYGIRKRQTTLQKICNDLPQKPMARTVQNFHKRLRAILENL